MVANPAPARRAASAASRAAPVATSPPRMVTCPRAYLWSPRSSRCRCCRHRAGAFSQSRGAICVQYAARYADIDHAQLAAALEPFQRIVTGLGAKERHRALRARRPAHHLAAVAVKAARHVDGDRREPFVVDPVDQLAGDTVDGTGKARAEQGVDHQRTAVEKIEGERLDRSFPALRGRCRIALQGAARPEQADPDRPARRREMAGRHEAVAAIVAGTAQHDDRPRPVTSHDGLGHGPARPPP